MTERIRVIAVAVPRRDEKILLERGSDPTTGLSFLRAIGGGVEFQERSEAAVVREWREELGVTLRNLRHIGVIENTPFTYKAKRRHEIIFVHAADVAERWIYERDELRVIERAGSGATEDAVHDLVWTDPRAARHEKIPVFPAGLLEMLDAAGA